MLSPRGLAPLTYRRLGATEMEAIASLEFDREQTERFLGPLADILHAARRGLAHHLIGIEAGGALAGFYVVHPDPRDASCWWLGWFAVDRSRQGVGIGRVALLHITDQLRRIPTCRRIRLLVAPDNAPALRLYAGAGFALAGVFERTAELIMQCAVAAARPSSEVAARFWANAILLQVITGRACRMGVPAAAQLHGEVAHPP